MAHGGGAAGHECPEQGRNKPEQQLCAFHNGVSGGKRVVLPGVLHVKHRGCQQNNPENSPGVARPCGAPGEHGIVVVAAKVVIFAAQHKPESAHAASHGQHQGQRPEKGAPEGGSKTGNINVPKGQQVRIGAGQCREQAGRSQGRHGGDDALNAADHAHAHMQHGQLEQEFPQGKIHAVDKHGQPEHDPAHFNHEVGDGVGRIGALRKEEPDPAADEQRPAKQQ